MSRNPNWSRDELILALDLYFRCNPIHTDENNINIIKLSNTLNALPIHTDRPDEDNFRNPNGVYMKLCNFLRFDPSYTGSGLKRGSKLEQTVWDEYSGQKEKLHEIAASLYKIAQSDLKNTLINNNDIDDDEVSEGKIIQRLHFTRERNSKIVTAKKKKALNENGNLECEVCGFNFMEKYKNLGNGFIECHHKIPLSKLDPDTKTKLSDLALVCSNCHRMLHRGSKWLSILDLKILIST